MSIFTTTLLKTAGVTPNSAAAQAVLSRENIMAMSQAAETAVLKPRDPGAFRHTVRAALAARVARLSGDDILAAYYLADAGDDIALADPAQAGDLPGFVNFVDKVANQTRDITAEDISGLQADGISDADIVRLCELVAFLAYQIRVISGVRLMQESAA